MAADRDTKKLQEEACERIAECRAFKSQDEQDIREAYFFCAPQRARDISSTTRPDPTSSRPKDAGEAAISLGMEVASDFVAEILNTFIPSTQEWAEQKPGVDLAENQWLDIEQKVREQTRSIFDAIRASNFYEAAALGFEPDLPVGTVAMWISDLRPAEPIVCQPVPIRELEINVGPYGGVDDRFIVRWVKHRQLPAVLPGVDLPEEIARRVEKAPHEACEVRWGWWRDWARMDDVVWRAVVMIGDKIVWSGEAKGEGSCPLIVARFGADPMFPFGKGPALRALPEYRRLDEVELMKIENFDFGIHPPFTYPDDGVVNLANGIEPGKGYPVRPGNGRDFVKLSFEGDPNIAEFVTADIERRIRRLHYVDFPEQKGDTPPTRAQWLDQMARAMRRIGTPGLTFWKEMCGGVFHRFKFLQTVRGAIEPIQLNGKQIALVPYNPAEAAQDQQDIAQADSLLEIAQTRFPQTAEVAVDQFATLKNLKQKMRDEIVVLRDPAQLQQTIEQLAPVLGGGAPAAAPAMPEGAM